MSASSRAKATSFTVAFVFFAGASACTLYGGSLLLPAEVAAVDAATDGAVDASTSDARVLDGASGCHLADPPSPPTTNDGTLAVDVVFAVSAFRLVPDGTASVNHPQAPVPLDLDGVCTCPGAGSCTSPASRPYCDTDGGGDDSTGALWATFAALSPTDFSDDALNKGLRLGYNGLLFRLKGYNGGQNDTQVTAIAYVSAGTPGVETQAAAVPKYDGTDVWTVDPSSLIGGDQVDAGASCEGNDSVCIPVFFDVHAYVSNGVLVAHVDVPVVVGGIDSRLRVALSDVVVVAPILFDGTNYRIDEGRLAGRWPLPTYLASLQSQKDPANHSQGLCGSSESYQNVKMLACNARDIMSHQGADNTSAACDALSITVSFSAVSAHLGPIAATNPLAEYCDAGYTDNCSP